MVCVGEAYKHQLKQMWQIADVQSLYASRCGLASLLNTLIPSQKEKNKTTAHCLPPTWGRYSKTGNPQDAIEHRRSRDTRCTFLDEEYIKNKNTSKHKCARSNESTEITFRAHVLPIFFIVFLSVFIKDFVRGRNIQRDTFANLNKHTVQYIQSELDTHSFHAIQWKHLKPGWPSPWSFPFLLPLLCSPPIYRHSTLFEATNAPGRFLTGGVRALMTLHAKLFLSSSFFIFYFFKCPTLGERTAQWRQWCWTAELLFFFSINH